MLPSVVHSMPYLSRRPYALEWTATVLLTFAISFLEGGTISVFLKQAFAGQTDPWKHNLAVALAGSAGELANIISFFWITASQGRPKVRFLSLLQTGLLLCIAGVAVVPISPGGLWAAVALVILARIFWSGIVTLRTNLWRANYPREYRARIVGHFSMAQQLTVGVLGFAFGAMMDMHSDAFRAYTPCVALIGLAGVLVYGKIRFRGEREQLRTERQTGSKGVMRPWGGLVSSWRVMRADRRFAQFMVFMFLLGLGNLMVVPLLAISLARRFGLEEGAFTASVLITSTLPNVLMPLAVPVWAGLLDRSHVVRFRAVHGWFFVAAQAMFMLGMAVQAMPLMYTGAVLWGVALGGGALAWNLGHTDFAPPAQNAHYMATHVTLNGLRGLLAPFLSAGLYTLATQLLGPSGVMDPAAAVLAVSVVLSGLGAAGFVWLRFSMGAAAGRLQRS